MNCFVGIKNKETYEKYYEKLTNWHLDIVDKYDVDKIKKLLISCKNTIMLTNESKYKYLLNAMKNGDVKRSDLELFLFKLDYYITKINELKIELGCHVVSFNEGYKDVTTLRSDFNHIYKYMITNKEIKGLYPVIHKKYQYILQGSTSDFMTIKSMKQAKYIKIYIELLWLAEEVNKLWKLNVSILRIPDVSFNAENILVELENVSDLLHKIVQLYVIYNKDILRLLKKTTCFQILNPYDQCTYDKIDDVINYIYYYDKYIIEKTFYKN